MLNENLKTRSRRGFTLVELMVVVALLTIVMGIVATIFLDTVATANLQDTNVRMQDESRRAFQRTIDMVRTADVSTMQIVDTGGTAVNFANGVVGNGIIFRVPTDTDGDFTVNDGTGNVEFTGFFYIGLDPNDETRLAEWNAGSDRTNDDPIEVFSDVIVPQNNDGDGRDAPNGGFVVTATSNSTIQLDIIMERPALGQEQRIVFRTSRNFGLVN